MIQIVNNFYENLQKEFTNKRRESKHFHVSDLPTICPRAVGYARKYNVSFRQKKKLVRPMVLAFAYGIAIQKLFSRYSSYLISKYRCPKCGTTYYLSYENWKDIKCKPEYLYLDEYAIKLESDNFKLVGHIDSLYREYNKVYIAEIKSISAKQFEELKEPLFDHVMQVVTYLWMFNRKKVKVDKGLKRYDIQRDKAFVLYFKKDFQNFDVKKFSVGKNEYNLENRIKELLTQLLNANEESPKVCSSKLSPNARHCQFREICFRKEE